MSDEKTIIKGASVWVGGHIESSALVLDVVEGRRVTTNGPAQPGVVKVKIDSTGEEVDVSADDIERVL